MKNNNPSPQKSGRGCAPVRGKRKGYNKIMRLFTSTKLHATLLKVYQNSFNKIEIMVVDSLQCSITKLIAPGFNDPNVFQRGKTIYI